MKPFISRFIIFLSLAGLTIISVAGCGEEENPAGGTVQTRMATTATKTSTIPARTGIVLDPGLQSITGIPVPDEMKALITLQGKVTYPVIVPTELPSGYRLDTDLTGSSGANTKDPVGYYSFRYSDPGNESRTLTFNQSHANSKQLSGYYLTETEINGVGYQVYWHKTKEYLPAGDPVKSDTVGEAEVFVVVWKGQFTDAAGKPQDLWYSMSTGTWTGHGWGDVQAILAGLKPLSGVGS